MTPVLIFCTDESEFNWWKQEISAQLEQEVKILENNTLTENVGSWNSINILPYELSRGVNLGFPCECDVHIIETHDKRIGSSDAIQMAGRSTRK